MVFMRALAPCLLWALLEWSCSMTPFSCMWLKIRNDSINKLGETGTKIEEFVRKDKPLALIFYMLDSDNWLENFPNIIASTRFSNVLLPPGKQY